MHFLATSLFATQGGATAAARQPSLKLACSEGTPPHPQARVEGTRGFSKASG